MVAILLSGLTTQCRVVGRSMGDALSGRTIRVIRVWRFLRLPLKVDDIVVFIPDERARQAAGVDCRTEKMVKRITRVDGERFFVEGDARHLSCDSNNFGAIGRGSVVGVLPVVLQ